jgi:hypothetical protein
VMINTGCLTLWNHTASPPHAAIGTERPSSS